MWITAILAASIPIFTAIAATLAMHQLDDLGSNEFAVNENPTADDGPLQKEEDNELPSDL